jgi:HYR domain-containing protein
MNTESAPVKWPWLLAIVFLLTQTSWSAPCIYSFMVPNGYSMIANQCDNTNGNTLNNVFPSVPEGSQILKWNCQAQAYEPTATFNAGAWTTNLTLNPGEGAFFINPGPAFLLTVSGVAATPVPVVIANNTCCMVSRQEPTAGGVSLITQPQEGDQVIQQEPGGGFTSDLYGFGVWSGDSGGNEPVLSVGESAWYCRGDSAPPPPCEAVQINTQPQNTTVLLCCSNFVTCAVFSVGASGSTPIGYQWFRNGVAIPGATSSNYTLCPVSLTNSGNQFHVGMTNYCGSATSQVATLTVTLTIDTNPPVLTCPTNFVLECDAWVPPPNPSLVAVSDACDPGPLLAVHESDVVSGNSILRTYCAVDGCGNTGRCTQVITFVDTMSPVFHCVAPQPNLVPNPGFENYTTCPSGISQWYEAPPWYSATYGTPDYFNACAPINGLSVSVPTNAFGNQSAYGGQAYMGIYCYGGEYREYLAAPLATPLVAGRSYEVSFYVSLAERGAYAIDRLGAYFSAGPVFMDTSVNAGPSSTNLPFTPQVESPANMFFSNTNGWTLFQGTLTAAGGEKHVVLGNYRNDTNTSILVLFPVGIGHSPLSYVYIDDVIVREICESVLPTNKVVSCGQAWAFDIPEVRDGCCGTNITLSILSTVTNGTCPRVITRTWQATDCASNSSTWSQSITLIDTNPPVMTCPTNIVVAAPLGQGGAVVNFAVTATDSCDGTVPVSCSAPSGFFAVGTTLIRCIAVDACNNTNQCSFSVTVTQSERIAHCSFTQGFYGNAKGKFNGTSSLTLISNLLAQGPLVVGKTNSRSLTIQPGNAALLQMRMPAGGSPATLPNSGNQILPTAVLPLNGNGRFNNVLLGQTITLSLNVRLAPPLLNVGLAPTFCTQGVLPGPDGLKGTTDDVLIGGDILMFSIPNSVLSALTNGVLGITNVTVKGLLELANRALAAQPTGGATLSDINAAVDAINRGFDECRVLVDCSTGMVIFDSFNDGFTNSPPLGGGGGGGFAARRLDAAVGGNPAGDQPAIIRVRVPNLDATKEPGEPDHAGNPGGKSVWWRWVAPRSGPVLLQTSGTSFDSLLAVYTGAELSNLVLVASNDDPSEGGAAAELTFQAQTGTEYRIVVDGFDGGSGTIELRLVTERPHLCLPVTRSGNDVQLCLDGELGRIYTVEASSDLANWTPLASLQYLDGALSFTDPSNSSQRFYRVILEF